jgi:DNA polymerase elongation subunit (family B)|tara:strand:+ start:1576 stop:2190 length:615 start_codon:yes stop_codon:yes gene_type:complete
MSKIMAIDIETANYSYEIGGWDKTHLFEPVVVATWDGENAHIFSKADTVMVADAEVHPLHPRELGEHLQKHIEAGGKIIGHNIRGFDLPVLRDALDMHYAGVLIKEADSHLIDTSWTLRSSAGQSVSLDDVCKHTLGRGKEIMHSEDAPVAWRESKFLEVMKYCLQDCQLNYDLFKYGQREGVVKARHSVSGIITDIEVLWKEE